MSLYQTKSNLHLKLKHILRLVTLYLLHRELFIFILCYIRMILRESLYYYGFKISGLQVYRLKESHLEKLKVVMLKKLVEMPLDMTLGCFVNL